MFTQYYLPIIDRETKKVLGLYNLGQNIVFDGTEVAYTLAAGEVAIEKWEPTPSLIRDVNPGFMASVWGHEEVRIRAYRGFAEYIDLMSVLPASEIGSSSGLANYIREYRGPVLEGLAKTFAVG